MKRKRRREGKRKKKREETRKVRNSMIFGMEVKFLYGISMVLGMETKSFVWFVWIVMG